MKISNLINLTFSVFAFMACSAYAGETEEAKKLGFDSVEEMRQIHAKGWHTKERYEIDQAIMRAKEEEDAARRQGFPSAAEMKAAKLIEQKMKKEEEEQTRTAIARLQSLKVKGVALGPLSSPPCTIKEETYVDIMQKPVRMSNECEIGSDLDVTTVIFSGDKNEVVSVVRKQYIAPSDPTPEEIINQAIKHYGQPKEFSLDNWVVLYGDAYYLTYDGARADANENEDGAGLLIQGHLCADGRNGTVYCGGRATRMIQYKLINHKAYKKSIEDGEMRIAQKNSEKIQNQNF